jgi:chromosomal replication initiator protein
MVLSVQDPVFSVPYRFLWSANFGGELEALNQRHSGIDRFVGDDANRMLVGVFSQLASRAGMASHDSCDHFWPLVFYGPSGTGKTSLALAVLAELVSEQARSTRFDGAESGSRFLAMTGADFDRRYRSALATDAVDEFRFRFQSAQFLLIDGVQQLAEKRAAQLELVQLIDQLATHHRPVILNLDQSPLQSGGLIPQLVSRLTGGLSISIHEPGPAARSVIIQDFCRLHSLNLSEASIGLLSRRLNVSVPKIAHFFGQLKAALKVSAADVSTEPIDPALINRLFERPPEEQERITRTVIQLVANEFKLRTHVLSSSSRKQSIVFARGVAIYLLRKMIGLSFLKIGAEFGNRDHSTIMHAFRKMDQLLNGPESHKASACNSAEKNKILEIEQRVANCLAAEIRFD